MARQGFRFERQWKKVSNSQQPDNIGQCNFVEQQKKLEEMMSKVRKVVSGIEGLMNDYSEFSESIKEHENGVLRKDRSDNSGDQAANGGVDSGCESGPDQDNVGPESESQDTI